MSSDGEDNETKKRRVQRACDLCRRKKVKCDGLQIGSGRKCSNCAAYSLECTYQEAAKKRGPPKAYIESLENRINKMDGLLRALMPDTDFTKELGSLPNKETWTIENTHRNIPDIVRSVTSAPGHKCHTADRLALDSASASAEEERLLEEELQHLTLEDNLDLNASTQAQGYRFFGKSSGAQLVKTALDLKMTYAGLHASQLPTVQNRPAFWAKLPWEQSDDAGRASPYTFPPADLLHALIELYFTKINFLLPLLHRPTFEKQLAAGMHLTDDIFGAVVLLVCACASRYSDDPRVLLEGETSLHSSGWKWFTQVPLVRKSLFNPPTVFELQVYCLLTEFLSGSSAPQASWTLVGVGIRLAQDVGAHRRKKTNEMTVDSELWKRAFWVLVAMDRLISAQLGRPCAIMDEDIDIEFPAECDDEYWEHPDPKQAFKQPAGIPSVLSYFITLLKLYQLLSFCLRTIYSLNKSKILLGIVGEHWEKHIVAELDSALNKWVDLIPDHLRWDPNRENLVFFQQSSILYITYYHLQILVHRPFIPTPRNPSPLSFPSLAICTNAARSMSHVVDRQSRRTQLQPSSVISVFAAGVVLTFNIWGGQRSGVVIDTSKQMGDVEKIMNALQTLENRWHVTGRLWDILYELACAGDLPLPKGKRSNKREREENDGGTDSADSADKVEMHGPRKVAGSKRVASSTYRTEQNVFQTPTPPDMLLPLPTSSHDLGRIPLHGQFGFGSGLMDGAGGTSLPGWIDPTSSLPVQDFSNFGDQFSYTHMGQAAGNTTGGGVMFAGMDNGVFTGMEPDPTRGVDPAGGGAAIGDTLEMWSSAPSGFEIDDWGTYLTIVSEPNPRPA
ncbi:hypothetical protein CYLTODRAFT_420291 [Cylindrobasidium torrendii FP15055 ss-10]|uniref:Zn(2)-C6 fungal-type domain-containing protein n=1 Tax=Cylindrobasidium torrendii FP15055 ss-10 TaxID=1314674 RepID=A0A0D7BHZ8_9AGAR|nr:hypothetical protein CYLTODRAFT_420291 [Cylindrobasidium torrendii FP15055 ss-10]